MIPCEFCGSFSRCDCLERLHCPKAGEMGHLQCGPCLQDPTSPRFACGHRQCYQLKGRPKEESNG